MRPGELYFLLVPPPAGVGAFLAQHEWLAAILAAGALTFLGILIRIVNFAIRDLDRAGGLTGWQKERYAAVPERETARTTAVRAEEDRRMIELEAKQQRREFKGRSSTPVPGQRTFF